MKRGITRKFVILSYLLIFTVAVIFIFLPKILELNDSGILAKLFFGAAVSLLSALLLAILMKWANDQMLGDIIFDAAQELRKTVKSHDRLNHLGLIDVFYHRQDSEEAQNEILKGDNIFLLATTMNSLFSYRTKAINIIVDKLKNKDWKLKLLIVNPDFYSESPSLLDGKSNAVKLASTMADLKDNVEKEYQSLSKKLNIKLLNQVPCYFMLGNENKLIITFYDYETAGSQPVLVYEKNGDERAIYNKYKNQFDKLYEGESAIPIKMEEIPDLFQSAQVKA